ncbi:glycoside hydrolase family 43 protein [Halalkalibacter urbisdiaboli]|uniref:glycoside hydrolase family 43 protein n=1 Tax=Halalkalibacter urbisdiaboli TaxID=1960589 RepID=UPI000B4397B8|nr:glycoside hydrolase family 43 protein [Halalkalibacter urbisdiaboli]
MVTNDQIQIRDPFVYVDEAEGRYYLFGSTDKNIWGPGTGFDMYVGTDLETWDGPFPVFRPEESFYSDENFWAPEVHYYQGKYYMFATFLRKDNQKRGTGILVSDKVTGPFVPHSPEPVTPREWFSLDGTLYVDEEGDPWIVFCHEWVQVSDGEVCAQRLSTDLKKATGEPVVLFRASDAPWPTSFKHKRFPDSENYVTDGTFMFKTMNDELVMLWASFVNNVYAQGISRSVSGNVTGPWVHEEHPLYLNDGGHGMIFRTFANQLILTLHTPNKTPLERPIFITLSEMNGKLITE